MAVPTVIDIASRRVVGYATADHLRTELVSPAEFEASHHNTIKNVA